MIGKFDFRRLLPKKLKKKAYRDAYVGEHVRRWIAHQIRALRDKEEWNQGELSRRMGKPQSVVSRLEDPSYGKMTVNTLLEVASAFDVALLIKFVDYPTFLMQTEDLSPSAMQVEAFTTTTASGFAGAPRSTETTANVVSMLDFKKVPEPFYDDKKGRVVLRSNVPPAFEQASTAESRVIILRRANVEAQVNG